MGNLQLLLCISLAVIFLSNAQEIINQDDQCLNAHNLLRAVHEGTGNLVWDSQLARESANYAAKLARSGGLKHSSGQYGENLFMKWGGKTSCAYAIKSWYDESQGYNYNSDRYQPGKGHFTAIVWKATTKVGVGIAYVPGTKTIAIVARYTPRGNFQGRFSANVGRPKNGVPVPSLNELETSGPVTGGGVVTRAPPPQPTFGPNTGGDGNQCLNAHNMLRAIHQGTKPLQWDARLASESKSYAYKLAQRGSLTHSRGNYGENLYMSWGSSTSCAKAIKSWYDEESMHNYNSNRFNYNTGHFTQVVWKGTTHVGVGIAKYGSKVVVVARYTPAGNMQGRFTSNVARRISGARVPSLAELEKGGSGTGTGGGSFTKPPVTAGPVVTVAPATRQPITNAPQPNGNNQCLNAHNMLRAIHQGTKPLQWDARLASESKSYAYKLAQRGSLTHSRGNYGENLYMSWGSSTSCAKAIKSWYDEERMHNYNSNRFNYNTGHFTQVVWKGTTHVGVGIAKYGNKVVVVARYTPAGNMQGRFTSNVARRISGARVPSLSELESSGTSTGTGTGTGGGTVPTQPPRTSRPTSCTDRAGSWQCSFYKRKCLSNSWVQKYCKRSCNRC